MGKTQSTSTNDIILHETIGGEPVEASRRPSRRSQQNSSNTRRKPVAHRPDPFIWGIYIMILIISCIEVYSASSSLVTSKNIYKPLIDHFIFVGAGFVLILFLQNLHYKWYKFYATPFFIFCLALLIYSTCFGMDINGAKRSIDLKIFTLQPPEMMKLAIVLFLAKTLAVNQKPGGVTTRGVVISVIGVTLSAAILWFNGLTNAAMLMVISIAMFLIGGIEWRKLGVIFIIYASIIGIVYATKYEKKSDGAKAETEQVVQIEKSATAAPGATKDRSQTHGSRLQRYLNGVQPDDSITDDNMQVMYSNFALANGGWTGQGPGNSRESTRLPLAYSDYIFSIIVEDTGFIGGCFLLILYLCLLGRAGRIASKCRRAFPALLIMGCAVMIVTQALVHMTIAVGLGPVSGQPLPFISKGGTSIFVMSAAIGMMLSVSRFAVKGDSTGKENKADLDHLPEDLQADNPTMIS